MKRYDHGKIEKKWQKNWESQNAFAADDNSKKPKYYALIEFPYPSGDGLHVGHVRSYTAMDIVSRKRRMEGYNVLYPIGWDAFGLPTENYAIKTGLHPREVTKQNTDTFRRQMKSMGFSFDWDREINTTDPKYYKWTQWMFIKLFEKGLAYKARVPINWCLSCKIGLANEEVVDGRCERCGGEIEKRDKEQWMIAITKYAEELLAGLEEIDYIPQAKIQQENWIGRSEGADLEFPIAGSDTKIKVFTTRPDTLFGATYMVLAPEHELIHELENKIENISEVKKYVSEATKKTEMERTAEEKVKTGIELKGIKAINPATKEEIPVFVADYVLIGYGTGAIMAVPAHDQRDFEFARKYNLPIREVILEKIGEEQKKEIRKDGVMAIIENDDGDILIQYNDVYGTHRLPGGGSSENETDQEALKREVTEETGYFDLSVGELIGSVLVHYPDSVRKVNKKRILKVYKAKLNSEDKKDTKWSEYERLTHEWMSPDRALEKLRSNHVDLGEATLLQRHIEDGKCFTGSGMIINSDKFDGMDSKKAIKEITKFVGSSPRVQYKLRDWVFSRQRYWGEPIPLVYCKKCALNDPVGQGWVPVPEDQLPVELPDIENYQPTDTGESPLAAIESWVNTTCPKCDGPAKRETDVMPNWAGSNWYFLRYTDPKNDKEFAEQKKLKHWMPVDWYNGGMEHTVLHLLYSRFWNMFLYDIGAVPTREPYKKRTSHGMILGEGGIKMSKSKGNVITPDDLIKEFGADALRLYQMFIGPFNQVVAWDPRGILGPERFLKRVWDIGTSKVGEDDGKNLEKLLHQTIKKVSDDIENMSFNTAVSTLMIFANACAEKGSVPKKLWESFLVILYPFAPHITEELWEMLGEKESIRARSWPQHDPELAKEEIFELVIQVNGKVRGKVQAAMGISEGEAKALAEKEISKLLEVKETKRVIFVKDRLINFII